MLSNTAIILAAGAGTRMKSAKPKVLHEVGGKTMVEHVISQVKKAGIGNTILVIGKDSEKVKSQTLSHKVKYAIQEEQIGTGHAVMQAIDQIDDQGNVMILCGDTPLITSDTIKGFMNRHEENKNHISVLTFMAENPENYGRIVRNDQGEILRIVEEKDANEDEKLIKEVNSGIYCFQNKTLKDGLKAIRTANAQKEYYLTDVIEIGVNKKEKIESYRIETVEEAFGINTRIQLAHAEKIMRKRILTHHMEAGVTFINPENTYIDEGVTIGQDTIIEPGVILKGNTIIGSGCMLGAQTRIEDSEIGDETQIQSSTIIESKVGRQSTIGPYAYLRPHSNVGNETRIGDFVEIKNATIGDHTKVAHLAYVGDATVGKAVNIGCGVIFVNYNGIQKQRVTVEDHAFVGSNSNLIAPVVVEKGAYIGAGTTVTTRVVADSLCVGRMKQKSIPDWANKMKEKASKKTDKSKG